MINVRVSYSCFAALSKLDAAHTPASPLLNAGDQSVAFCCRCPRCSCDILTSCTCPCISTHCLVGTPAATSTLA